MKSFAILSLAAAAAAVPAPDHIVTALVTCTDGAYPKETVTVTAPCDGNNGNGGYGGNGGNGGNGGYGGNNGNGNGGYGAPVTVTITETQTETKVETVTQIGAGDAGATYTQVPPPEETSYTTTYDAGLPPTSTLTGTDVYTATGEPIPGQQVTHTVAVGAFPQGTGLPPSFEFRPNNITASKGDLVKFQMLSAKHSVTQSNFDKPCVNIGKFDTDLIANAANDTGIFKDFVIEDTSKPLWFYCKNNLMVNHCGKGMVFGINPKSQDQMQQFINMAKAQNGTTPPAGTAPPTGLPTGTGGIPVPTTLAARFRMW